MRTLGKKWLIAGGLALWLTCGTTASAQLGGGGTGGGGLGGGGLGGGGAGGGGLGGGGAGGGGAQATGALTETVPSGVAGAAVLQSPPTVIDTSNILRNFYANPLYPGRANSTNISIASASGFGQRLYQASGATAQGANTRPGGLGTAIGGGATGRAVTFQPQTNTQPIAPGGRRINYTAELKFPTPQIAPTQIQSDLQNVILRSTRISNPSAVSVMMEDGVVILRGQAASDDEKRMIEGMLRLSPGVRQIKNELTTP